MLFSSFATFTNVLDNPVLYGFESSDIHKARGKMWIDHLHPTSKMHDVIAHDVSEFLGSVDRYEDL
jgi:hypothetical protein